MRKRVIPLLLALSLLLSLLTVPAMAASPARVWDGVSSEAFTVGQGTREAPYLIATPGQLAYFRNLVNYGETSICARVVADLDLGGHAWIPIGLTTEGYNGVFDGGGRSIQNMRLSVTYDPVYVRDPDGEGHSIFVSGLFGVVGERGVVKYVNVSGKVTGSFTIGWDPIYIGGIAGEVMGTIEECASTCRFQDLVVSCNEYVGLGGIAGSSEYGAVIKNCYSAGAISAKVNVSRDNPNVYVGGIIGYQLATTQNCYSIAPISVSTRGKLCRGGIAGITGDRGTLTNCYYDKQLCAVPATAGESYDRFGAGAVDPTNCKGLKSAEMKKPWFLNTLGSAFVADSQYKNNNYPVLAVMTYGETENSSAWYRAELSGGAQGLHSRLLPAELIGKDLTRPITRVEFAAVAVALYEQMSGKAIPIPYGSPFTDTSSDTALKAWSVGLTNGTSANTFSPYATITRQDLATMLTRVYKAVYFPGWTLASDSQFVLDYSGVAPFQDDGDISGYAKPSVYFMAKHGIVKGVTADKFAPRNTTAAQTAANYANATREQAMIMAIRTFSTWQK